MNGTHFDRVLASMEVPERRAVRPPGLSADLEQLKRVAIRDRWGLGLMAIGWVHLATFLACHAMYRAGNMAPTPYVILWMIECAVVVVLLRRIVTSNGRQKAPPLVGLLARVWVTFIILGLSVASLNRMTGMPPEWFKSVWCTLSTFGFAMLAWITSLWFLIPAVQMSLTGMLIAALPKDAYLIYAVSWFVALHAVGLSIERLSRLERVRAVTEEPSNARFTSARAQSETDRSKPVDLGVLMTTTS